MMLMFKIVILTLLSIACCQTAGAQPKFKSQAEFKAKLAENPLRIFLARGREDACGPGCRDWIAVDGTFDLGSAARFRAFLKKANAWKLPVYFDSVGGSQSQAMEIGRVLRSNRMTAAVSATDITCAGDKPTVCDDAIKSGRTVDGELRGYKSRCNSSCLTALFGATTRLVPSGAAIGVHATGFLCTRKDGTTMEPKGNDPVSKQCRSKIAARTQMLSTYYHQMGADKALFHDMTKVPNDQMRFLTRDDIMRYNIETTPTSKHP